METEKEKTDNYIFENRLLFRGKANRIIKYFLRNLDEGNEPAIKSISVMRKSTSGSSFCKKREEKKKKEHPFH